MIKQFWFPDRKRIRVIIDSDTACDADDPFAIVHAMLSPKLIVRAVIAEHFAQPESLKKSYKAVRELEKATNLNMNILWGEKEPGLEEEEPSEGVKFIIEEARRTDSLPLYILCLGALTTIARAVREAPDITGKMTVISVGGQPYEYMMPWREFNFGNDVKAANCLLSSKVNFWYIPSSAYSLIRVSMTELEEKVACCGRAGKYLFDQMTAYNEEQDWPPGESWSLGDLAAVAVALDPLCGKTRLVPARYVLGDTSYGDIIKNRMIRIYDTIDSRYIIEDFYAKLRRNL